MKSTTSLADLRGLIRLVIEQAALVTELVEDLHSSIAQPLGLMPSAISEHTQDITSLVYRSIHGYYILVGTGIDAVLSQVIPLFDTPPSTPAREAMLAVLNGIWGDYLSASNNPLAIQPSLRYGGQSLSLQKAAIQGAIPQASSKIVLFVHGLCMSDLQWSRGGHNYPETLTRDFGYTAIHLHYNSGLHVSTNGQKFADLLERLIREWLEPVEDLTIIAHSMGGLVTRSACHYGKLAGHSWLRHLRKLIFLGTPHHGSPLERIGNWADEILKVTPYTAPFRRLGMKRSAGITDLRYGNLIDEDWAGIDRFTPAPDNRQAVPLPGNVQCYAIGATIGAKAGDTKDWLLGDGLVPLDSALGLHSDPNRCLAFPQAHQWIGYNMSHLDLLNRAEVYQKIGEWLTS